jgi:spoIIIJ-associated protein
MEWVEVTGKTVEEAKDAALDQLGVDEADAEFEVVEEARAGLFGRLRSEARVRARVLPSAPRPKVERRERRRTRKPQREPQASENQSEKERVSTVENDIDGDMEDGDADEVEVAETFLTGLLETFGAPFTVERRDLEDDMVELSVTGEGLGLLIGPRGQTLAAVQELTRTVVQRKSRGRAGRIVLDVSGYRQARRQALERFALEAAEQVKASGVPRVMEPMPPADRKVVHDALNPVDGVGTTSEGEEPRRRVVITPTEGSTPAPAAAAAPADAASTSDA